MHPLLQPKIDCTRHYRVTLVEKTIVPRGAEGNDWYRYVLESEYGIVTRWRRGSLQEVTQHAQHYAEELNIRSDQGTSLWALRRKKVVSES